MCGIAGFIGRQPLEPGPIERALERMRHRGPDDASHQGWDTPSGGRVELLHTRLTIIDFDARSNQPFRYGDHWLAFNGELYNYVEVRRRLEAEGATFTTASDTEVLAAALDRGGPAALDGCEGMWALAAYDSRSAEFVLSRDRFGEKPLYLFRDERGLFFGSEAKFVFALMGSTPPVNRRHLQRYLVNGYKSLYKTSETFFEGLEELEPGTVLRIRPDGTESREAYWSVADAPEHGEMSFEEAVSGTRERLIRSVELRLRADVPLAFCMSGGVDSLSLISIARNVFDYDVHGFTIVNSDERYEEQDMVEYAVEQLGVRHTAIPIDTHEFLPRLRTLVRHHDAPVYTITYFVQWLLMQSIHEHGYRVSVSGTAADELFSGYYDHHLAYLRDVQGDQELAARSRRAWAEHVQPVVRNPFLSNPDLFVDDPSFRGHIYLGAEEFASYLTAPFDEGFDERRFTTAGLLRNRMLNELFAEAVPVILHEDDLNAMYFSIENRSPFLDRDLFEFSQTIPTRHLIQDGKAKAVLRESMRGIAPDRALENRRKVGFNAPIHALLDVNDPSVRAELLADSPLFDVVRRDKLEALLDTSELPNSESKLLFNILCTKLFLEEFAGWITPLEPPRTFRVGEIEISHVADVELGADEQVTFTTTGGTEFDVVRKAWGYYATPSLNRRLPEHGLRPALCRSPDGRTVVLLCERGQEVAFAAYLEHHRLEVLGWLDREYCPMCRQPGMEAHFLYDARPEGETLFDLHGEDYQREVLCCPSCGHFVSRTPLDLSGLYDGDYMDATYAGDQLRATYERIMGLPPEQSDNAARVDRIIRWLGPDGRVLDVGSGLGVFPARMQQAGWHAVALDPDPRAAEHTRSVIGIEHVQADFFAADLEDLDRFDLVTLNKVLEHVEDPVAMLARASRLLADGGCVYIELPDGEMAAEYGPGREEFFVEHLHVFSMASMALLARHAGLRVVRAERLCEPSTKYTLFAFCVPA